MGISYEDGSYLARLLEREGRVVFRIKTTERNHEVKTWNVVGDEVPPTPWTTSMCWWEAT